jgi:HK97 family phage prohead protease
MNRHLLLASLLLQPHQRRDAEQPQTRAIVGAVPTSVNEQERSVEYVCSTEDIDSYGTILRQTWDLERYRKNPVVLFAHKYDRIPVGRAANVRIENRQLLAKVFFATEEECKGAEDVWRAVKNGYMPGISVGFDWRTYRWEKINGVEVLVFDNLELRELSLTPVPSNPNALARGVSSSSDPNLPSLEQLRAQHAQLHASGRAGGSPLPSSPSSPPSEASMTPEQLKALQEQLRSLESTHAANTREISLLKEQIAAGEKSLQEARAALAQRDEELKTRGAKLDLLTTEVERLRASETKALGDKKAAEERATQAEDSAVRFELRQRMGEDVDPAEVEHLVQMKRNFPAMYEREMTKRDAAPKAGLTRQVLPTGAGSDNRAPAVPPAAPAGKRSLSDAIRSHMPPAPALPAAPPALPAKG